jgi:hypothetical protein
LKKDFKEIPQSLSEPELHDFDSDFDDDSMVSSTSLGGSNFSNGVPHAYLGSAPSLTTLESTGSTV